MKVYALNMYPVEFETAPTHENVYEMLWSKDSDYTTLKYYNSLEEAAADVKNYRSKIRRQERYALPGFLWVGELYLVESYETNGEEDPTFWQPLDVELEAPEDFEDKKATAEDLIAGGEVIDSDDAEDVELVKIKTEELETAALVYSRGTVMEEVYFLQDMQGAYPETLGEAREYDWIRALDVKW